MTDGQRLTDRLAALVADEPPFETDLGNALWAAETGGRRRRARMAAVRASSVTLAAAAASAVALVIWWPAQPRALPPPPARSVTAPVVSPTLTTAPTNTPDAWTLRQLVTRIAAQLGDSVEVTNGGYGPEDTDFPGWVQHGSARISISASKSPSPDGFAKAEASCRAGVIDQFSCRVLLTHDTIGVFDVNQTDHRGHRRLWVVARTPDGGTLTVNVDNELDQPNGKSLGPDWEHSGITTDRVCAAMTDSGLAVPDLMAGSTDTSTDTSTTTTPANAKDVPALRALAKRIAAQVNGKVEITGSRVRPEGAGVTARVQTHAGPVIIWVGKGMFLAGVKQGRETCRGNGRYCRTLLDHDAIGIWDNTYDTQPGRRKLEVEAAAAGGQTVSVQIENYPIGSGSRIGLDWKDAGITAAGVRAAIAESGLAVPGV